MEVNANQNEWEMLLSIEHTVFSLSKQNITNSANSMLIKYYVIYPLSFDIIVSQMIIKSFAIKMKDFDIYIDLIQEIKEFEKNNQSKYNIIDIFIKQLLQNKHEQERNYLLEKMIELNLKQIIQNDEIEKLQEISSQNNFDFNQIIEPSLYEKFDFINNWHTTLIDYAAFFGSIKCFKYLLLNGSNITNAAKYAIASENIEIIHLCEQYNSSFQKAYETAIKFHLNDIFNYLYENKIIQINDLEHLGKKCIEYHNYEIFAFLLENGMKISDDIIYLSAKNGNILLTKHFLKTYPIPKYILFSALKSENIELFKYISEQKGIDINNGDKGYTPLLYAFIKKQVEMIKLLIEQKGINVNVRNPKNLSKQHLEII